MICIPMQVGSGDRTQVGDRVDDVEIECKHDNSILSTWFFFACCSFFLFRRQLIIRIFTNLRIQLDPMPRELSN